MSTRSHLFCLYGFALVFGPSVAGPALGQDYPNKPVRIIVPFGAGGSADVLIRIVANHLSAGLGQQMVIDNRTGAGGLLGTSLAAQASPDGYTLLGTATPHSIVPHLYKTTPYDALKAFSPITQFASQPYGLVVHPSLGVTSVKDLIALAKKEPGKHNYASSGQGGAMHLFQALFVSMADIDLVHVPYKSSGAVRSDLQGGQVKIGCIGLSSILPAHKAGQLRIIAVTSAKRSPELPDIPSLAETLPGYDATLWTGFVAPAGTPTVVIDRLYRQIAQLMQTAEVKTAFQKAGTDTVSTAPKVFGAFLESEHVKWGKVVRNLNLQVK
jgi:tripartite-type tricarboxylate transporter receptor subunit TctC